MFFSNSIQSSLQDKNQSDFLSFIASIYSNSLNQARIVVNVTDEYSYEVKYSISNKYIDHDKNQDSVKLPFKNEKDRKAFIDLVSSFAWERSITTSQAVSLIEIMLGKKSGKIEFTNKGFIATKD